ncbi:MAG: hypothetical protein U0T72_04335 [Chitinophagales bacterium]
MNRILMLLIVCVIALSSCKKECTKTMTYKTYEPVYLSLEELRKPIKAETPQALKKPGKIYTYGKYLFVNDIDRGIHVIDNSNPAAPQKISFINIPGNIDLAVKGSKLYADSYIDLLTIDISNPAAPTQVSRIENAIPDRNLGAGYYYDPAKGVVKEWKEVLRTDTFSNDCNSSSSGGYPILFEGDPVGGGVISNASGGVKTNTTAPGKGGSMARFAIAANRLYVVDQSSLKVFSLSNDALPTQTSTAYIGRSIETIFPYQSKLFIGSMSGMFIYGLNNADAPDLLGSYSHATACDPVAVEGNYAFVTLRSGTICSNASNQLDVVDISNAAAPTLVTSYAMTNPHGVGIENGTLFVCDGSDGLKVFDATDVTKITDNSLAHFQNIQSADVIPFNKKLIMTGEEGIFQYDYSDTKHISLLSVIRRD